MLLHIGIDDTDSQFGGCTTYVMFRLVERLRRRNLRFADYPKLVRLNPYIPFKTRGNAAVALTVDAPDVDDVVDLVLQVVDEERERRGKVSPGVAVAVGEVPERAKLIYRIALSRVVPRRLVENSGVRVYGGRGVVGATAAIGAELKRGSFELLAYRRGVERRVDTDLLKSLDLMARPFTYSNVSSRGRELITPSGPDPVLFGIRGFTPFHVMLVSNTLLTRGVDFEGWMIYRTNQGTDSHWRDGVPLNRPVPYSVVVVRGVVVRPLRLRHGHTMVELDNGVKCFVYRHLGKLAGLAERLVGCDVLVVGGAKPRGSEVYVYVEKLLLLHDTRVVLSRRACPYCGGTLKSLGSGKGYRCRKCKAEFAEIAQNFEYLGSSLKWGLYEPRDEAWKPLYQPVDLAWLDRLANKFGLAPLWFYKRELS